MNPIHRLENIMGVLRTFVCSIDPVIHGREERTIPLTYKDAAILTSEVTNLRLENATLTQKLISQNQEYQSALFFFEATMEKFSSLDPLWDKHVRHPPSMSYIINMQAFVDSLAMGAGVIRDNHDNIAFQELAIAQERIDELQEDIALSREKTREVLNEAITALRRVLPQAMGSLVIEDIKSAITSCEIRMEELP